MLRTKDTRATHRTKQVPVIGKLDAVSVAVLHRISDFFPKCLASERRLCIAPRVLPFDRFATSRASNVRFRNAASKMPMCVR